MTDEIPTRGLLGLDDAIAQMSKLVQPIYETEPRALADALSCVTADALYAPYALPPYTNTGVDGFAFRHAGPASSRLRLIGQSLAGEPHLTDVPPGCAVHIATGGFLPPGTDTVAMQEYALIEGDELTIDPLPEPGANIRHAGNDIQKGARALDAHEPLTPQNLAFLAALGYREVKVLRPLRVAIVSTGSELQSAGDPLAPGQIVDTNSLMLKQILSRLPVDVTLLPLLRDDRDATDRSLQEAAALFDVVITTGGVSVGRKDYVRDALRSLGKVYFWKLAIRPGKPVMFGQIGTCWMVGLPGNPVSVMVTFYLIALPLLHALWGRVPSLPFGYEVTLGEDVKKDKHLRSFPRARLEIKNGKPVAFPFPDQSSNLLSSLVQSQGLLDLPVGLDRVTAGTPVIFRDFGLFH